MTGRQGRAVGATFVIALTFSLVACSGDGAPMDSSATCMEIANASQTIQNRLAESVSYVDLYAYYSPAGVEKLEPGEYLRRQCSIASNAHSQVGTLVLQGQDPTCDDFLVAIPKVREDWIDSLTTSLYPETADAWEESGKLDELAKACVGGGVLGRVMQEVAAGTFTEAIPENAESYYSHFMQWTTTSKHGLLVGGLFQLSDMLYRTTPPWGPLESMEDYAVEPLTRCQYDPATDGVLEGFILATNRSDSPAQVSTGFVIDREDVGRTSVSVYSGGYCDLGDGRSAGLFTDSGNAVPVMPGAGHPIAFYIIVHDYFSPAHPDGDRSELSNYTVVPRASWSDADDPIIDGPQDVTMSLAVSQAVIVP